MPFLWLKCGEIVGNFVIRSDDKFKVKGDGSVCQVFNLDASTVKINGTAVPSGADGWTEVTVTELGFVNTSEQTPLPVTGCARVAGGTTTACAWASAGTHGTGASPSTPKTIDIIIPPVFHGDDLETIIITFNNDNQLLEYLCSNQVVGLQGVTQGPNKVVRGVAELDPSITYTHAPFNKEAFQFPRILREARHLQQAREDEMGRGMLKHLKSAEPDEGYELKKDLRLQLASSGKIREGDVVIVGKSKAWIGSHKTHAKGTKPVVEVADRAKDLANVSTQLPAQVLPAFMVERVDADIEPIISKACKDLHVLRFHRSGRTIKVVSRMGVAGRQLLRKF